MLLKNIYNQEFITNLSENLEIFCKKFNKNLFVKQIFNQNWKDYSLKERMRHISVIIDQNLLENYQENIKILKNTAQTIQKFQYSSLSLIIFADFVEKFGLDDFETSIDALQFFTSFGSSEFAIRKFFLKYEEKTLKKMLEFSLDKNCHIRRFASEGLRPKLPWGIALKKYQKDPSPILPILENLKNDKSEYVRRSVANNLNDISKDNSEICLRITKKWQQEGCDAKMIKHSLRTLLKEGNKKALKLVGYGRINAKIINFNCQDKVKIGEDLVFSFVLENLRQSNVRIEYAVYFLLKNNNFSRKIFQIKQGNFEKKQFLFRRKCSFKKISTRKYYPGAHKVGIILNGEEILNRGFTLFARPTTILKN
ncbi:MAG: 3-methyladenine DNA glycosylase AlkC [Rickettsiales bacterium]|jgi:3-methyladenine DNA glycosylase AlkC